MADQMTTTENFGATKDLPNADTLPGAVQPEPTPDAVADQSTDEPAHEPVPEPVPDHSEHGAAQQETGQAVEPSE